MSNWIKKNRDLLNLIINIILIILGLIATYITFFDKGRIIEYDGQMWKSFRYYTNITNLISLGVSIALVVIIILRLVKKKEILKTNIMYYLRLFSAASLSVVFFTVMVGLIAYHDTTYIAGIRLASFHIVCPILVAVSFIFLDKPINEVKLAKVAYATIPTIGYAIVASVHSICGVWPEDELPYPFLDVYNQPLWFVIVSAISIVVFSFIFSYLYNFFNKKVTKKVGK